MDLHVRLGHLGFVGDSSGSEKRNGFEGSGMILFEAVLEF
jgi:hypothetical protein